MRNLLLYIYNWGHDVEDADFEWWEWHGKHPIKKFWRRTMASHILHFVDKSKSSLVLGCGSSPFTLLLGHYSNRIVGVDISKQKVDFMMTAVYPRIEFVVEDIRTLNLDSSKFDLIIASEVLEHITRRELAETLPKLCEMVEPGGRFIVAAPDYSHLLGGILERLFHWYHYPFSFEYLDQLFTWQGFSMIGERYLLWDKVVCYSKIKEVV